MTHSGIYGLDLRGKIRNVLIPLLLDDPLWGILIDIKNNHLIIVLIPLLLDDPLWENRGVYIYVITTVLIPLLLDDLLWDAHNNPKVGN